MSSGRAVDLTSDQPIKAVVQKVVPEGKHGPFIVLTAEGFKGSITLSLEELRAWQGDNWPEQGEFIALKEVIQKRAGWRAKSGRYWNPSDEQTANSKEQTMKRIKALVECLKKRWWPPEDDEVWKDWVDFKDRDEKFADLIKLVESESVRDTLKSRAIFFLLLPRVEWSPLYWKSRGGNNNERLVCQRVDFLKRLTPDLQRYAAKLVCEFSNIIAEETKDGIRISTYRGHMLELIALLPDEDAESVFACFPLNDSVALWCNEDASEYNPFRELLCHEGIDELWKRKADTEMRGIIFDEASRKSKFRKDWEKALSCYAGIVSLNLREGQNIPYSVDLFADQIAFVVDQEGSRLIRDWDIIQIFNVLDGVKHRDILHRLSRSVAFRKKDPFCVWNKETLLGANAMLKAFGETDDELGLKLQEIIAKGRQESVKHLRSDQRVKDVERLILSRMGVDRHKANF